MTSIVSGNLLSEWIEKSEENKKKIKRRIFFLRVPQVYDDIFSRWKDFMVIILSFYLYNSIQ